MNSPLSVILLLGILFFYVGIPAIILLAIALDRKGHSKFILAIVSFVEIILIFWKTFPMIDFECHEGHCAYRMWHPYDVMIFSLILFSGASIILYFSFQKRIFSGRLGRFSVFSLHLKYFPYASIRVLEFAHVLEHN